MMNRLVTRGMGTSPGPPGRASMVASGMGGIFVAIAQVVKRVIRVGQSGTKRALRELEEVVVWAKMIRVNDEPPPKTIQGFVKATIRDAKDYTVAAAKEFKSRVKNVLETVKIRVDRIK